MKLVQLKLSNFRCYKDEVVIDLDDLVVFVGRNDAGKSSLFEILEVFFEGKPAPDKDDLCVHAEDGDAVIRVACVFDQVPPHLVLDAQHPTVLAQEHLVNPEGFLEIVKSYDCSVAKPKCSVFARALHPTAEGYADLLSLTITQLRQRAESMGVELDGVNQAVSTELRRAIWNHAEDLAKQEVDVPLNAQTAKAIWEQLKKHVPVYALFRSDRASTDQDAEAQDPMKAAIKEAIKAQEEKLAEVTAIVKDEVQAIANCTVEKIQEMNPELARELTPRVDNKAWHSLFSVSLTGDEAIPVNKRGSGTRRLVLLNFFRAKAEQDAGGKNTGVIYAIEEPETSQHPHNQSMLVDALEELAERSDCQVLITTHTPVLARRFDQSTLRLVAPQENGVPSVQHGRDEDTIRRIVESLGVLPDHNIKVFLGVEGRNDIHFFCNISKVLRDGGEVDIPDLQAAEAAGGLVFIPLGGSSLDLWVSKLQGFNRPEFYIFDRDSEPPEDPHYKAQADQINARDNCTAWHTGKRELENYIHKDVIVSECPTYGGSNADHENVPELLAQAVHEASDSDVAWADVLADPVKLKKKESNAKKRLNSHFAAQMTPELLSQIDPQDDVRNWLRAIGAALH